MKKLPITLAFKNIGTTKFENEEANYEANFVSTLFSENLDGSRLPKLDRITVELLDSSIDVNIIPPNKFVNICQVRWFVDIKKYQLLDEKKEKYSFLLERLMEALLYAAKELNWKSTDALKESKSSLIKSNYTKKLILIREQSSPNKKDLAFVTLEFGELENVVSLEINNKQIIELFKLSILEYDFGVIARKLRWISNSKVEITNMDNEIIFRYDLSNENLKMSINPQVNTEEYIKDELKLLDAKTSKEDYVRISNKRLAEWKKYRVQ
ncbi:MAG: hypothetical protein ABJH72_08720 [Reichenbachiella sp.]|uniref:hypothetical protein n=1 Tax=Reichenbachiella sp. TaxID=2184521 RepID=UPI0032634C18